MKPWMYLVSGAIGGIVVTAAGAFLFAHRWSDVFNEMQYTSAAAHASVQARALDHFDKGEIEEARKLVHLELRGNSAAMAMLETSRGLAEAKVVRDAKAGIERHGAASNP